MTARFTDDWSARRADGRANGTPLRTKALTRLRALTNEHFRQRAAAQHHRPRPLLGIVPPDIPFPGSVSLVPHSHAVRSACGLTSFLGLLSVGGTLLEVNLSPLTPPELDVHDTLGRPFWEASWWSWSPVVQQRLIETMAKVAGGKVIRYDETALVRRNQLITVDLALAPCFKAGRATALICSVVDLSGFRDRL